MKQTNEDQLKEHIEVALYELDLLYKKVDPSEHAV